MSWFKLNARDYQRERPVASDRKNQKVYSKKEKLPSQAKSKKCSLCRNVSVTTVKIGRELRRLCKKHRDEYFRKDEKEKVIRGIDFRKASSMINND